MTRRPEKTSRFTASNLRAFLKRQFCRGKETVWCPRFSVFPAPDTLKGGHRTGLFKPALKSHFISSLAVFTSVALAANTVRADDAVDFVKDIQPILEYNCVHCHHQGKEKPKGGLRLDVKADFFKGGKGGVIVVPGDPSKSTVYTYTVLPVADDDHMPPKDDGEPLTKEQTELLRKWILQGAKWPDGVTLVARKKEVAATGDDSANIAEIHKKIIAAGNPDSEAGMKRYTDTIPGTQITFDMLPIPGGTFMMGSPATEAGRKADEGPQHKVTVSPFWMEKCEVTWNEFELFMYPESEKRRRGFGTRPMPSRIPRSRTWK